MSSLCLGRSPPCPDPARCGLSPHTAAIGVPLKKGCPSGPDGRLPTLTCSTWRPVTEPEPLGVTQEPEAGGVGVGTAHSAGCMHRNPHTPTAPRPPAEGGGAAGEGALEWGSCAEPSDPEGCGGLRGSPCRTGVCENSRFFSPLPTWGGSLVAPALPPTPPSAYKPLRGLRLVLGEKCEEREDGNYSEVKGSVGWVRAEVGDPHVPGA